MAIDRGATRHATNPVPPPTRPDRRDSADRRLVHRRRLLKSVAFLIVRDAAGLTQVVVTDPAVRAELEKLPEETVVEVVGTATSNGTAPAGSS
ncbi:OB-fold nucleic acid binding domain-containing protein [Micromonospora sp. M12]